MSVQAFIRNNPVLVGAVLIGGVALAWLALRGAKGMGRDIGAGAVNLVAGTVGGATGAIVANANDPNVNPLHGFGTWLGGTIYDLTH